MIGSRSRPRRAQISDRADRDRDRPRRRDDERRVRAHGHDRQGVQRHLRRVIRRYGRGRQRQGRRHQLRGRDVGVPSDPGGRPRAGPSGRRGPGRDRLGDRPQTKLLNRTASRSTREAHPRSRSASRRARVRPLQSAQPRRGPLAVWLGGGRNRRGSCRRREPRPRRPDRRRGSRPRSGVRDRRNREVRR